MTLDVVGLDEVEQRVYEAVLAHQPATMADLRHACGVEELQLVLVAKGLASKSLISEVAGAGQFVAAPPEIAVEALLLDKEAQIKRARLLVQRLAKLHDATAVRGNPGHLVEVVAGRDAVLERFAQAQRSAREQVRVVDRPPYLATSADSNVEVEREVLGRGVRVRAIYDPSGFESFHQLAGDVQKCLKAGEEARVMPDTPVKFALVDDRMAMLALHPELKGIDSLVVVYPSALMDALAALFEQLWDRALPLRLASAVPRPVTRGPTFRDRQLLGLLTAGLTDETIAKQLGVSHRTMQRRLRALFDRLGVQTRFQAGLRAASLGWVSIDPEDPVNPRTQSAEPPVPYQGMPRIR